MFIREDDRTVRSSDGFTLQRAGLFTAEYREGGKLAHLHTEPGAPGTFVLTNASALHWANGVRLSPAETTKLLANLRAALAFIGLRLDVSG